MNPYAGALMEPGRSKRAWDAEFLVKMASAGSNDPIRFELTSGQFAAGRILQAQHDGAELTYLAGELTAPEPGKFFFLKPPTGSKAGKVVGVIEFPGSQTAYRIEPTGVDGEPELWQRRFDEVVCMSMPLKLGSSTNEVAEMPPLRPDALLTYVPGWNSNIVSLQSLPGSPAVLLLDFFGGSTPTWGGIVWERPNVSNSQIKDLWKRVAEDYMPFNINVTTDIEVFKAAPAASRQRCVFTPATPAVGSSAAGVAYIGSWNWGNDTVCWSIYTSGKSGAEVGAHEAGHTLGLGHQGTTTEGYYGGHGSGSTGWAPIMGAGYYQPVTAWARGEYQNANNTEDELGKIVGQNNSVDYRLDDTGSSLANARHLEVFSNFTASAEGVIETTGDTDAFQFSTSGGQVSLTAAPIGDWANLAVMVTLANSAGTVIASNNPQSSLSASIVQNVPAGSYTFRVTGAGRNNPLSSGFTTYASLGYYSVTGAVAGARLPSRFAIAESSPNGTTVGTIAPATSTGNPLTYTIVGGNSNNAFTVNSAGVLTVANSGALNYETLAAATVFTVQYELFVNIIDTLNPAASESNRRVVISITNVNERPTMAGFSRALIDRIAPGTIVGQVNGSDPDFYTVLRYSFGTGNTGNMFALDSANGVITVAGTLDAATQASYNLNVIVSDQAAPALTSTSLVSITVISNRSPFQLGSISYAGYENITGTAVSAMTSSSTFPRSPSWHKEITSFEGDTDRGDNYGAVIRGYLIPPASGTYTFWIASDDNSQLIFSTTTNPLNATLIASVGNFTSPREWTKYASQQSAGIALTAGQAYYIEARMKEGSGGDNLAVAWQNTSAGISREVIPGRYLAPFTVNYTPAVAGFSYRLHRDAIAWSHVGAVEVTDLNPGDQHTFAISSGNVDNLFWINPTSGVIRMTNEAGLRNSARSSYSLQVRVVDNGAPALTNTATITYNLYASNAVTTTNIRQEMWNGIGSGNGVSDLLGNARYPSRPDALRSLGSFDSGEDVGEGYGSRIRAYLTPTTSGAYTFYIASDDNSRLLLSTDSDPANATQIATLVGSTDHGDWTANASQRSAAINLVAGQRYYIETLHKEGGGGDHVAVAWTGPNISSPTIISSSFLDPFDLGHPPTMASTTGTISITAANGAYVAAVSAVDSDLDIPVYKIVSGNNGDTFAIDPVTGRITLVDQSQLAGSGGTYQLTVQAQDTGYGGLFPLRSAFATVTVNIVGANWPPTITLVSPVDGTAVGAPVSIQVSAADANNNLSRVEFYGDGQKLGQLTSQPFTFTWTNSGFGAHTVHAVAVDTWNYAATSAIAQITVGPAAEVTFIPTGAVWQYLDNGSDQGTVWRGRLFNDAAWKSGRAQLGYGDNDEATRVEDNATAGYVAADSDRYITTYFRHSFVVHDPAMLTSLAARVKRDDGVVAYLNGTEFFRNNMPAGTITFSTLASSGASDDGATFLNANASPSLLVAGTNVIAVEIHQNASNSSDMSFDFELKGSGVVTNRPSVRMAQSGGAMSFTWPADEDLFVLAYATNLAAPATWIRMTNAATLSGNEWRINLPASTNGQRFYRLENR